MTSLRSIGLYLGAGALVSLGAACTTMNGDATTTAGADAAGRYAEGQYRAEATLRSAAGATVGTASAQEVEGGLRVTLDATALPPGAHGAHVHMTGRCDAPDFTSAGGHWNPTGAQHGMENPAGPHAGDMPNLLVGTNGAGSMSVTLPGRTLASLLDADGAAIVVHAGPDDMRTDPSGNSGGRIACGVFLAI